MHSSARITGPIRRRWISQRAGTRVPLAPATRVSSSYWRGTPHRHPAAEQAEPRRPLLAIADRQALCGTSGTTRGGTRSSASRLSVTAGRSHPARLSARSSSPASHTLPRSPHKPLVADRARARLRLSPARLWPAHGRARGPVLRHPLWSVVATSNCAVQPRPDGRFWAADEMLALATHRHFAPRKGDGLRQFRFADC